jgi:hypothetical protein
MRRRIAAPIVVFAVAACSPAGAPPAPAQSATAASTPAAVSTGSDRAQSAGFTLQPAALAGQWSFDRGCGLYDLVFNNDSVSYFDYADPSHVVSYAGVWTAGANNRVQLSLHRLDAAGAPSGAALIYNLDVTAPVAADLTGGFGPAGGAVRNISAKKCASEDRE